MGSGCDDYEIEERRSAAADALSHYSVLTMACLARGISVPEMRLHLMQEILGIDIDGNKDPEAGQEAPPAGPLSAAVLPQGWRRQRPALMPPGQPVWVEGLGGELGMRGGDARFDLAPAAAAAHGLALPAGAGHEPEAHDPAADGNGRRPPRGRAELLAQLAALHHEFGQGLDPGAAPGGIPLVFGDEVAEEFMPPVPPRGPEP